MTKGQVQLPVGVTLAEGGLPAGCAAREAQGPGTADHSQGQGQDSGLKGPSVGAPKPQRLFKLIRQEKGRQTEDHEFQVTFHYIDFEACLGYIGRCSP